MVITNSEEGIEMFNEELVAKMKVNEAARSKQVKKVMEAVAMLDFPCWHFIEDRIFSENCLFDEVFERLSVARKAIGNYDLKTYYQGAGSTLAIRYAFKDAGVYIVFQVTDTENALEKISGGKCKIITRMVEESEVVCGVE